jgi:hypothetical protein
MTRGDWIALTIGTTILWVVCPLVDGLYSAVWWPFVWFSVFLGLAYVATYYCVRFLQARRIINPLRTQPSR